MNRLPREEFDKGAGRWLLVNPDMKAHNGSWDEWYDMLKHLYPIVYHRAIDQCRFETLYGKGVNFGKLIYDIAKPLQIRYIDYLEAQKRRRSLSTRVEMNPEELAEFKRRNAEFRERLEKLAKAKEMV